MRVFKDTQSLKEEHVLMNSIIRKTLGLKYHRVVRIRKSMSEIEIKIDRIRRRPAYLRTMRSTIQSEGQTERAKVEACTSLGNPR